MNINQLDIGSIKLLENDFQEVLNSLTQDPKFVEFKKHYENMLEMLKQSHKKEIEINNQCHDLSKNIQDNASKIKAVINIAQSDQETINQLKKDLQDAKNIFLIQKEKDETNKKKMENLQKMWKNLEIITQQNQKINSEKIEEYNKLLSQKKELQKEIQQFKNQNDLLENNLTVEKQQLQETKKQYSQLASQFQKQEKLNIETEIQINKNNDRLKLNQQEIENYLQQRIILKNNLHDEKQLFKQVEQRFSQVCQLLKKVLKSKNKNLKIQENLKQKNQEQNQHIEYLHQDIDSLNQNLQNLALNTKDLKIENNFLVLKYKQQLRDINSMHVKQKNINSNIQQIQQDNVFQQKRFNDYNKKINVVKQQTKIQSENLQNLYCTYQNIKMICNNLGLDNEKNFQMINTILQRNNNLTNQINPLKQQKIELEKIKNQSFAENEKSVKEINGYYIKLNNIQEELLLLDNIISEMQKKSSETEQYLQEQQKSYEKERMDRNIYSKNLKETQDEISEMKRKMKIAINQIDQLKEEYQGQQEVISQEKIRAQTLLTKFQQNCKKNENFKEKAEQKQKMIKNLNNEIAKLKLIQGQLEDDTTLMANKHLKIISERDYLVQNLVQKNDEIFLLKEKNDIQENTLKKGELEFQEKVSQQQYLKILFRELSAEIFINKEKVKKIFKYQKKIKEISQKIAEEDLKVKALSEELENPLNVNRWRNIGEQNQDTFELIEKIQELQKKLIKKTEKIISQNLKITSQKDSIKSLDTIHQQNPGIEEAKQLLLVQRKVKSGQRRLKSAAGELNLYKFKKQELNLKIKETEIEIEKYQKKFGQIMKNKIIKNKNNFLQKKEII